MIKGDARLPYPLGTTQAVAFGAASARTSNGVDAQTRVVTLSATEACFYAFGDSSVAATSAAGTYLPANGEHLVRIRPGQYVAAIQESTGGNLFVSEFGY